MFYFVMETISWFRITMPSVMNTRYCFAQHVNECSRCSSILLNKVIIGLWEFQTSKACFNICNKHFQRALFLCIPPSTTHQQSLLYVEEPSARSVFLLCVVCNMMCRMLSLVVFLTGLTPENNMAVCLFLYSSLLVSLTCSLSLKHTRTHSHTHTY